MDDNDQTQVLKFLTDTHIAKAVSIQLRARGVDIIRCEEVGLANAKDVVLLEYAIQTRRVFVSIDQDVLRLHHQIIFIG